MNRCHPFTRLFLVLVWLAAGIILPHKIAAEFPFRNDRAGAPLPYPTEKLLNRKGRYVYAGESLNQINFPLGGIGSGCVALNGRGALVDWSIFGKPNLGWRPELSFFGLWAKAGDEAPVFRVLEGEQAPPYPPLRQAQSRRSHSQPLPRVSKWNHA